MFTQIINLDGILRTPTWCKCEQEISPNVDSQLGEHIPILRIRIHTGGPICATDLRCTLVSLIRNAKGVQKLILTVLTFF
jgi:hypothetical protein